MPVSRTSVRLRAGVRPVEEEAAVEVSGPGSEKRTFFLVLVGVFMVAKVVLALVPRCCGLVVLPELAKPLVRRRFRRTAIGWSSEVPAPAGRSFVLVILPRIALM